MSVTSAQAVTLLENVLFESSTVATANAPAWVAESASNSGESTVAGLASAMAATAEAGIVQQVVRYYMGALGRVPSGIEIQYYVNLAEGGLTATQIAQGASAVASSEWAQIATYFAASPEFTSDFGLSAAGQIAGANQAQVVSLFYSNILGRLPSLSEIAYYENLLNTGTSLSTLIQYFTESPEYQTTVDSNIDSAVANYGTSVTSGTTPTTIPYAPINLTLTSTNLTVTGLNTTAVVVTGTAATAAQTAQKAVTGVIAVTGVTTATGVQGVTAVTQVTPVAGVSAITAVTDGSVTINDASSGTTGAGIIKSVTLADSGAGSVINDNALTSLSLIGTTGTLAIKNLNTAAIAAHSSVLSLTVDGLSATSNTITDTNSEISTLNVTTATADSVLAGFADTNLTTLTVAGTNKLTLQTINSTLTSFTLSGGASFSDGATSHGGGLAALGAQLTTIADTSTGNFAAALDDTTQSFSGGAGTATIMVSSLVDATKTINAGSAKSGNELVFEGGAYALTSASAGKFVDFQTVGVAADVSGTIDLSVVDSTASALEVMGANAITFVKVATGASLLLDPSFGATVSVSYADSTGAKDSVTVTLSSAVNSLTLQDAASAGIGTVSIVDNLAATDTDITPAYVIGTLNDAGLATLNVSGSAGLSITSLNATSAASFTLNNTSTDGYGVLIGTFADTALTTLTFNGTGTSTITTLAPTTASLTVANKGTALDYLGTITDNTLTSLTLAANVALGQAATALTTDGLQDSSAAGVTVSGGSDNSHVTVNLTAGAASGKTDTITLGNGNNVVVDASVAGTVTIQLGTGANLVELGSASLDATVTYNVTFAARTATPPNAVFVGADGTKYNTAPNLTITGASTGDIIDFGNDGQSSSATLTATTISSAATVAAAIVLLETAVTGTAHEVAYGVYKSNTYIVETASGVVGATDTTVVEVVGSETLTASTGFVTIGSTASKLTTGGGVLTGSGFTLLAGTAYFTDPIVMGIGGNVVTLVGPSAGVTDLFVSNANAGYLHINYQATIGTDTIQMSGVAGSNASDVNALTVNDTSAVVSGVTGSGSAGVTIGAFTDSNNLQAVTYTNSAAIGALMTQQTLTSSTLNTINFTGGVSSEADNYFFTGTLSSSGTLTINDSNVGSGTTTLGLTLTGGASALVLNNSGGGTLATGTLPDNNLTSLTLAGSNGTISAGAVIDTTTGAFSVIDNTTSSHADSIVLSGLAHASSLTVTDSAPGSLSDGSLYTDDSLTALSLSNTGQAALTIGGGGLAMYSPVGATPSATVASTITISGSAPATNASATITTGTITDTAIVSSVNVAVGALTITDSYVSTGLHSAVNLPLDSSGNFTVSTLTVNDSSACPLNLNALVDPDLTSLTLSNTGSSSLNFAGGMTVNGLATFTINLGGTGSFSPGTIVDDFTGTVTVNYTSTSSSATTLPFGTIPNATGFTVNDNATAGLTVAALTDDSATTLTFSNSGSGALTVAGITDTQANLALNVPNTGIGATASNSGGPMTITLTGAGSAGLAISDQGTGSVTVDVDTPTTITIANSGASTNNITVNDSVAAAVNVTLTGTANQAFTLTESTNGGGSVTLSGIGSYAVTLPSSVSAVETIHLSTANFGANANTTAATTDQITNFHLDNGTAVKDILSFGGFTASDILTAADVGSAWTVSNGMMSSLNATVLNFVAAVQGATQAAGAAGVAGVAGFLDGHGNTWIAYNDGGGSHVAVVELVGISTTAGLEAGAGFLANFVHIS